MKIAIVGAARQAGLALPNAATGLFSARAAHGGKPWGHSAIVGALELVVHHDITVTPPRKRG